MSAPGEHGIGTGQRGLRSFRMPYVSALLVSLYRAPPAPWKTSLLTLQDVPFCNGLTQ